MVILYKVFPLNLLRKMSLLFLADKKKKKCYFQKLTDFKYVYQKSDYSDIDGNMKFRRLSNYFARAKLQVSLTLLRTNEGFAGSRQFRNFS